jgi:hypothetical protein
LSKKSTIFILLTLLILIIIFGILLYLNKTGYIKIFGSTTNYQKIQSISNASWPVNSGFDKIDFSSGPLKLKSTTIQGQAQDTTNSIYLGQCCGGGCGTSCAFSQSITGNHQFYLPANTFSVTLTDIAADDYFTSLIVNNNTIIGGTEKYHSNTDITPFMNLTGPNTISARVIDTAGGAIAYHMNVLSLQHGQAPSPTTTFDSSGYYITQKIGASDLLNFDKLVIKNENKPAGTDLYYEFLPVDESGQVITDNSKCAAESKCTSSIFRTTNNEIDLKSITSINGWKFFAIRITLTSVTPSISPSLDGVDAYYTTQTIIPNYKVTNTYSFQSLSKNQPTKVLTRVIDSSNTLKHNQDYTLANNQTQIILPDNVSGNLKIYVKADKHLSRKIAQNILSDANFSVDKFLAGDFNNDDLINSIDWSAMNKYWQQASDDYDLTGDSVVNSLDWSIINTNWGKQGDGLTDSITF